MNSLVYHTYNLNQNYLCIIIIQLPSAIIVAFKINEIVLEIKQNKQWTVIHLIEHWIPYKN